MSRSGRKIKITDPPPVEKKHGITLGRVFELLDDNDMVSRGTWVMGDSGEPVKLFPYEWEPYEEETG